MKLIRSIRYVLVILSALLGLLGLSSTFGYELINNCYTFTSAGDYNSCLVLSPGEELYTNGFYNSVNSLINFNNGSGDLIWIYNNYNSNFNSSWFWNNGELYFVQNSVPNWSYFRLWKNNYFCQINSLDNTTIMDLCGAVNFQGNDNYNWDNYNSTLETILENFNGNIVSEVLFSYYPSNLGNDVNNVLCFKYNSLGSTFCIHSPGYVDTSYGLSGNWFTLIENNGISDGTPTLSKYGSLLELSPFNGGGSGGGSNSGSSGFNMITQVLYNYLFSQGYRSQLCYGGFAMDNIYNTGNSNLSNIVANSGANIFELYNAYSGGVSFIDWYDNMYLDYLYLKEFQDSYEYSNYIGKSKGLIGLGMVRDAYFRGDNFNTVSLRSFCQLVISSDNFEVIQNNSPIAILDESVGDSILTDIFEDLTNLVPSEDSPISIVINSLAGQSGFDLGLSGDSVVIPEACSGLDSASDLYKCLKSQSFRDSVNNAVGSFALKNVRRGVNGILPNYIIVGFLGIALLYFLRK